MVLQEEGKEPKGRGLKEKKRGTIEGKGKKGHLSNSVFFSIWFTMFMMKNNKGDQVEKEDVDM